MENESDSMIIKSFINEYMGGIFIGSPCITQFVYSVFVFPVFEVEGMFFSDKITILKFHVSWQSLLVDYSRLLLLNLFFSH
jgi:hypothetical protein